MRVSTPVGLGAATLLAFALTTAASDAPQRLTAYKQGATASSIRVYYPDATGGWEKQSTTTPATPATWIGDIVSATGDEYFTITATAAQGTWLRFRKNGAVTTPFQAVLLDAPRVTADAQARSNFVTLYFPDSSGGWQTFGFEQGSWNAVGDPSASSDEYLPVLLRDRFQFVKTGSFGNIVTTEFQISLTGGLSVVADTEDGSGRARLRYPDLDGAWQLETRLFGAVDWAALGSPTVAGDEFITLEKLAERGKTFRFRKFSAAGVNITAEFVVPVVLGAPTWITSLAKPVLRVPFVGNAGGYRVQYAHELVSHGAGLWTTIADPIPADGAYFTLPSGFSGHATFFRLEM